MHCRISEDFYKMFMAKNIILIILDDSDKVKIIYQIRVILK